MSAPVVTVGEDTDISEIARLLAAYRIKRVTVVRDGRIVGIGSRAVCCAPWLPGSPSRPDRNPPRTGSVSSPGSTSTIFTAGIKPRATDPQNRRARARMPVYTSKISANWSWIFSAVRCGTAKRRDAL
jgi:hypothetical protein